jgi:hypothetical protein
MFTLLTILRDNLGTLVVGILLLTALTAIVVHLVRERKRGVSALCGCNCAGCALSGCASRTGQSQRIVN